MTTNDSADLLVIGAGPTGMSSAIEAKRAGFSVVLVDKGCLVNTLYHYPANMVFFTSPELLEIGNIPFACANPRPTRQDALDYYRKVALHFDLDVRQYERVVSVEGADGAFQVHTTDLRNKANAYAARKIVVATGYYDLPNYLGAPGESLPKVLHYYTEAHSYFGTDVLVVGGKNSAAAAALDLARHNAKVTLVYRGPRIHPYVKYWIRPDLENQIGRGNIVAHFNSTVEEICLDFVRITTPRGLLVVKNDFVFALTGYHPDYEFLGSLGIGLRKPAMRPECKPQTLESNVPGIYVAGVIVAGTKTNEIFIEQGRLHGRQIACDLKKKMGSGAIY
jgi:thioredoxin reductase (NADPH)